MSTLVLTVIGDDRTGLVTALSDVVAAGGGNWERSQMAELAGKFAGIVVVQVPDHRADELEAALAQFAARGLLHVRVERAAAVPPPSVVRVVFELVGNDRPGIVREVSRALTSAGVSIDELTTTTREAPMAGGTLFEARAHLRLPADVHLDSVRAAFESVAAELMVDVVLTESG